MCYHTFKAYFLVIPSFITFYISENSCFYFKEKSNSRDLRGYLAEYGRFRKLNNDVRTEEPVLQWHPAFFAGIQIELREEEGKVTFESEHQLGTKPMLIDVLIIKKNSNEPMEKNIGRIFRKHNIVEYKSPKDYLSVDDFYKVYGYACFYKADVEQVDSIRVDEITLTFVCKGYPRKLIEHLTELRGFTVELVESGIYYIKGDIFLIQLIVTSRLSKEENFWLKNLTDDLSDRAAVEELAKEYHEYRKNTLYRSVMNVIIKANEELFKEESDVCEAIIDLFRDEYDKGVEDAKQLGVQLGVQQGALQQLISLVRDGLLTLEVAIQRSGLSEEEFKKAMEHE